MGYTSFYQEVHTYVFPMKEYIAVQLTNTVQRQ